MVTTFGFYLSGVIAVGIIFIGRRFLLTPSLAAAAYGGTRLAPSHIRKRISNAKGIRDGCSVKGNFSVEIGRFALASRLHRRGTVLTATARFHQ
jgi:hypothetical protein